VTSVLDLQRHYMRERHSPLAKEINISTIINDSLVMLSESIKKREIEVELNNEARGLTISGDQTRLIRVFLNIIKNIYEAFDQLEPGPGKKLDIDIRTDEKHNQVVISFKDNAIGFDSETAKKLFERGFTTKYNGSGIGLHECKSVIESHGGTFSIESSGVNSGALTTIKLPILSNASDKKE
jgi:signal transduction histidine kinase